MSSVDGAFELFVKGKISESAYKAELRKAERMQAVGKRVRIKKQYDRYGKVGLEGKIIGFASNGVSYSIHFDTHMDGHTCNGRVPAGYGYNVHPDNVEFID